MGTIEWVGVLFLVEGSWADIRFHLFVGIVGCVSLVSLVGALFLVTEIPLLVFVSWFHLVTLLG